VMGEMRKDAKPLQKAGTYLKGKTSVKLAGAADEPARTIDDSGLEPWMRMEAHLRAGEQFTFSPSTFALSPLFTLLPSSADFFV